MKAIVRLRSGARSKNYNEVAIAIRMITCEERIRRGKKSKGETARAQSCQPRQVKRYHFATTCRFQGPLPLTESDELTGRIDRRSKSLVRFQQIPRILASPLFLPCTYKTSSFFNFSISFLLHTHLSCPILSTTFFAPLVSAALSFPVFGFRNACANLFA